MINVNELENKWRKYKIKTYIPYFAIFSILILIIFSIILITNKQKDEIKVKKTILSSSIQHKAMDLKTLTKPIKTEIKEKNISKIKKLALTPSLNFISSIKDDSSTYKKKLTTKKKQDKIIDMHKAEIKKLKQKNDIQKAKIINTELKENIENKINIKINRKNTKKDIDEVVNRFQKNNNPVLSLFIAKKYYELKNYRQSYNYALATNQLNDKIEASWILFAKSLVKLNKRDEAIKTLKRYTSHTNSNQANILLENIISGKFK